MDQRVWLQHPDTGGHFHCPADAVADHIALGWQKSDPPEEPNPVTAENLAWRERDMGKYAAAARKAAEMTREFYGPNAPQTSSKPTKPARRGETTGELSNG